VLFEFNHKLLVLLDKLAHQLDLTSLGKGRVVLVHKLRDVSHVHQVADILVEEHIEDFQLQNLTFSLFSILVGLLHRETSDSVGHNFFILVM